MLVLGLLRHLYDGHLEHLSHSLIDLNNLHNLEDLPVLNKHITRFEHTFQDRGFLSYYSKAMRFRPAVGSHDVNTRSFFLSTVLRIE